MAAVGLVTPVGPDLDKHVASLHAYADAGVDELFVQQIGPEQDAFFASGRARSWRNSPAPQQLAIEARRLPVLPPQTHPEEGRNDG